MIEFDYGPETEAEKRLMLLIRYEQERHHKAMQPYIEELGRIRMMKTRFTAIVPEGYLPFPFTDEVTKGM